MKRLVGGCGALFLFVNCSTTLPQQKETVHAEVAEVEATVVEAIPEPVTALEWSPSVFSFTIEESGQFYVVTQENRLAELKAKSLKLLKGGRSAEAQLAPEDIPVEDQNLVGKTFVLFDEKGEVCRAKVESIVGIAQASTFDFGEARKSKHASLIWEQTVKMRAARLENTKTCSGAIWGREVAVKPANILTQFVLAEDTEKQVLKKFKALPGYLREQEKCVKYVNRMSEVKVESRNIPDWTADDVTRVVSGFKDANTGREYIQVAFQGQTGCDEVNTEFWAVFAKGNSGHWEVVSNPNQDYVSFFAKIAVDANLDGHPEFIGFSLMEDTRSLVERRDKTYARTREISKSSNLGGC